MASSSLVLTNLFNKSQVTLMMDFSDKAIKSSPFPPRKRFPQKTPKLLAEIARQKSEAELAQIKFDDLLDKHQEGDW